MAADLIGPDATPSKGDIKKFYAALLSSNLEGRYGLLADLRNALSLINPEIATSADAFIASHSYIAHVEGGTALPADQFLKARQNFIDSALTTLSQPENTPEQAAVGMGLLLVNVLKELVDRANSEELSALEYPDPKRWVTFSPDGKITPVTEYNDSMAFTSFQTVQLPEEERFTLLPQHRQVLASANKTLQTLVPFLQKALAEADGKAKNQLEAATRILGKLQIGLQLPDLSKGRNSLPGH